MVKDNYYYGELKRYINIILKNNDNIDDIQLFTKYLSTDLMFDFEEFEFEVEDH